MYSFICATVNLYNLIVKLILLYRNTLICAVHTSRLMLTLYGKKLYKIRSKINGCDNYLNYCMEGKFRVLNFMVFVGQMSYTKKKNLQILS